MLDSVEPTRTVTFPMPVRFVPSGRSSHLDCPSPFAGIWHHSTDESTLYQMMQNGWNPLLNRNSIYGTAVYLSRSVWLPNQMTISGVLSLDKTEVMTQFQSSAGCGRSQDHLVWFLKENGLSHASRRPAPGNDTKNQEIAEFFLERGVKAIRFEEHGTDVVALYDPSCFYVFQ